MMCDQMCDQVCVQMCDQMCDQMCVQMCDQMCDMQQVLQAESFSETPSGLNISDQSGSRAFKLYLIQVRRGGSTS